MAEPVRPSAYIPTLDGWRAVSIALVIMHHVQPRGDTPVVGPVLQAISNIGEVGVEMFFAISGLLICTRLLDEEAGRGSIDVKGFYLRRSFRILPAALFYLLVLAILAAFHVIPLYAADWFGALLFFRNYVMVLEYLHHSSLAAHWYTGHFWSLSIEEHFYLVLPAILVSFKRLRMRVLVGLAVAVALWRFMLAHLLHNNYQFGFRTDTHVDALLIPALIALALYPLARNQAARRYLPGWSFPLLLALEAGLLTIRIPFAFTLQAALLPLLLLSAVLHPGTIQARILECAPLRWIGRLSYSLYLWQQLFFGVNFAGSPPRLALLREQPFNLIALLLCAVFSYYAVEKPFVRLGRRLASASPARGYTGGFLVSPLLKLE